MDLQVEVLSAIDTVTTLQKKEIVDFLIENLGEFADSAEDTLNCLEYALSDRPHQGGMVIVGRFKGKIASCIVLNKTGMTGYIPENILVYIATKEDLRGQGLASKILQETLIRAKGDIALHVNEGNPAKAFFKKFGFLKSYEEMRLIR